MCCVYYIALFLAHMVWTTTPPPNTPSRHQVLLHLAVSHALAPADHGVQCTALAHEAVLARRLSPCVRLHQDSGSQGLQGRGLASEDVWTAAALRLLHAALRYAP